VTLRWLLLLALTLLAGCQQQEPLYQEQGYVFGTLVEISIQGEPEARARQAVKAVMDEFQRLHTKLHAWQPSELSTLNAAFAQGRSQTVSPELAAILQDASRLSARSHGLFAPQIGGLIHLWGFQADDFKAQLPDEQAVAKLVAAHPLMSDIDIEGERASSRNPAVQLDLGGYAKGYALDRAAALLREMGIHNALVNIGGNVMALGRHGDHPWRVGIQHPRKPAALATLELHDGEAVGTSGDYQRYFELDGRRYCHLIDPRSGHPAQGVEAVTVIAQGEHAGVLSDVASKAPYLTGPDGWAQAAREMGIAQAMLIDATGRVHLTAALQKRLEFTDKDNAPLAEP
jgi:thiamine biosynthesis lipoprotein